MYLKCFTPCLLKACNNLRVLMPEILLESHESFGWLLGNVPWCCVFSSHSPIKTFSPMFSPSCNSSESLFYLWVPIVYSVFLIVFFGFFIIVIYFWIPFWLFIIIFFFYWRLWSLLVCLWCWSFLLGWDFIPILEF